VPTLVQEHYLVALVPGVGPLRWAAEAAWDFARAALLTGRSVALVDLHFGVACLHEAAGLPPGGGISEVIARDLDLSEAAREVRGVFFIPTGDATARDVVLGSPRWARLRAGFRSQNALLLVFLNTRDLSRLSTSPDAVVLLAQDGVSEHGLHDAATLEELEERGVSLLGVVRERWAPSPAPAPAPAPGPSSASPHPILEPATTRERRPWRARALVAALATALLAGGGWALFARSATVERPRTPVVRESPAKRAVEDTLAWTVQLAAYGTLEGALNHADQLARDSIKALIAPVVPAGAYAVWYRVVAGSYVSRDSAAKARAELWSSGTAPEGQGDLLRAPYSLLLDPSVQADSLRRLGVPATAWSDGRVLLGAFESPEQAGFAEALVGRAGTRATVITRTGISTR
jgi:hypothetical protein